MDEKTKLIDLQGLDFYNRHAFPLPAQSSILTLATSHMMLQEQVNSMDGSKAGAILQINPDPLPISPGAIWIEMEE